MFVFSYPSANAFKLISGCSMLESLTLDVRVRQEDEEDYVFNIPTLKRLKLTSFKCGSWTHKVFLHVPNLEYLCVESLCSLFVMEDVSSLVEASVSLRHMPNIHPWVELLKGLNGVKSLLVECLSSLIDFYSVTSSPPVFPNMKHLVLHDIGHFGQVLQFLESSPELEQLCIDVNPYQQKPEEYGWVEPELVPACMTTNLTTINFSISERWKCDIAFLKYMMGNAQVLKTLTVTWKKSSMEKEKFCAEDVKLLPMASRYCEIQFHEK
ncbi:hypothetical protein M8C21_026753 [Ambrosia artemisiifolia]|uniref:FBD domain-containing protein n=1 Tax=Ambrosia artemisiifolia TaxID=4212 RepID=A0AAD5BMA3_AMBAR|nr:hypothetical protein M8C21_026753 [Ambrosia artemisiifolia]